MIVASGNKIAGFVIRLVVSSWVPLTSIYYVCYVPVLHWEAVPRLGLTPQPRSPTRQSQGEEEASSIFVGCWGQALGRWKEEQDIGKHLETPGIHSEAFHSGPCTGQGAGLEASDFLLFQTGIVTLAGPPSSMSPQSRYLILLVPILLAGVTDGEIRSHV